MGQKRLNPTKGVTKMKLNMVKAIALVPALLVGLACSSQRTPTAVASSEGTSYKDAVKQALQQAELQDVSVDEDRDKNTITLGGKVHSEDARMQASEVAKAAAGSRTIANEISVQPVGVESESKDIASDLDSAIEKNYKAALTAKGLDKEHIRFDAKNGVLTLKGKVKNRTEKAQAEELAQATPNVRQVLNQIDVNR
jgi:osmotically-inducible protein OsmY